MSNYPSKEQVQELMEYVGNNLHLPQLVQHFDKNNIYDTNEKLVGQWIDGRPLYQITVSGTFTSDIVQIIVPNFTNKILRYAHGVTIQKSEGKSYPIPCPYYSRDINMCVIWQNEDYSIRATICENLSETSRLANGDYVITLQYTKTTDTALTYKIGTDEDYSTDERLIGTWGNLPLYKKTISYGALHNTTSKDVDTGLSNVNVRIIEGCAYRPSDGVTVPLPLAGTTLAQAINMSVRNNGAQIRISTGQDRTDMTNSYVTLYYTKNS